MSETMFTESEIVRDNGDFGEYLLTKTVKSSRRTYFFDVRATKGDDYFVTITESRKRTRPDGSHYFDRHKIILYREDFKRFFRGLNSITDYIRQHKPDYLGDCDTEETAAAKIEEYAEQ